MKTIDRYVLGRILWPLATCVGIALLALLMERMVRLLDLVINEGGPLYLLIKMMVNLIPHYLGIALPAAFFVGVLLAATRLNNDSELDVMHASGVSLHRLLAPIMVLAVVLMVSSAIIIGFLQPYTRYGYRALVFLVTQTAWDAAVERGSFFTGFGGMTIRVEDISDRGTRLTGVFVHEETPAGKSITTTAAEGRVFRANEDFRLILSLTDGVRIETGKSDTRATVLTFDRFDLPLELAFGQSEFRLRGGAVGELTLVELWQIRNDPPGDLDKADVTAALHARLVRIATLLVLPLLAIPLGMSSRRTSRIGLATGLVMVVLYHHVLQFGESLVEGGRVSPWVGLWLPFAVFATIGLFGFYTASTQPGGNPIAAAVERLADAFAWLRALLLRRQRAA